MGAHLVVSEIIHGAVRRMLRSRCFVPLGYVIFLAFYEHF
jgi:hypothetical protein